VGNRGNLILRQGSAQTLTFGESAENNEMCIFGAAFYPLPDSSDVTVGCN